LSKIAENCDHNIDPWGLARIYGQNVSFFIHL
jgi:hypothetical protein